jgi:hypothetical protein
MRKFTPPTDKPEFPSYLCPEYLAQAPDWLLCADMAKGRSAWYHPCGPANMLKANCYLPKEHKEPPDSYKGRLARSHFDRRYGQALEGFAGLLSFFTTKDLLPEIEATINNVDRKGSSFEVFLIGADYLALRDKWCAILVDRPPMPVNENGEVAVTDAVTEKENAPARQPFLSIIPASDILNWSLDYDDAGQVTLKHVTIREVERIDSAYGYTTIEQYRVLTPGLIQVFTMHSNNGKDWTVRLESSTQTGLDFVPLVCYSATDTEPFVGPPPFLNLAELNLKLYQQQSDADEIRHKLNMPTPVRIGVAPPMPGLPSPSLTIGPNSFVDVPVGGNFKWEVPSGSAIQENSAAIEILKKDMERVTLDFVEGATGKGQKTATQVIHESVQTKSSLEGMARLKESSTQTVLLYWARYLKKDKGGSISVRKDVLKAPLTPEQIVLAYQANVLSLETALAKLADTGLVDDPMEELKRIQAELAQRTVKPPVIPGQMM